MQKESFIHEPPPNEQYMTTAIENSHLDNNANSTSPEKNNQSHENLLVLPNIQESSAAALSIDRQSGG